MHQNQGDPMQAGPTNSYLSHQNNQSAMNNSGQPHPPSAHLFSQQTHYLPSGQVQQNFPGRNEASSSGIQPGFPQTFASNPNNFSGEVGINQGFASFQQNLNRPEDKTIPPYQTQPNFQQQLPNIVQSSSPH
uniref:Uncharacterized protein n=1 Tax=Ditylenchus dipsaci TaxID=166011 RepID=A0A915D752_9BILA